MSGYERQAVICFNPTCVEGGQQWISIPKYRECNEESDAADLLQGRALATCRGNAPIKLGYLYLSRFDISLHCTTANPLSLLKLL
jgi:hypothetical protein